MTRRIRPTPNQKGRTVVGPTTVGVPTGVPVNSVAPVISGIQTVGQTLVVSNGTWTQFPTGYTYQWKKAGVNIGGATAQTYVPVTGDAGASITCTVTATNSFGNTSATSAGVTPNAILSISGSPATTATVGTPYSFTPTLAGGHSPYSVARVAGSLPAGLSLNTTTGAVTGTPTGAEVDAGITLRVTDNDGLTADITPWTITVSAAPAGTDITVGGLTKAGVQLLAVTGSSVSSGSGASYFTVTGGYLVPTSAFDTADLTTGVYSVTLNDASVINATIEANCYDVRSQADYNAVAGPFSGLITSTIGGVIAFLGTGPYDLQMTDGFGETARNTTFAVPVVYKARYPGAGKPQISAQILVTSDNLEWYDLSWAASTSNKVTVINSGSRDFAHLRWQRCEFHGVIASGATDHSTWVNQDTMVTDGGTHKVDAELIDCWFNISKIPVKLAGVNISVVGCLFNDFWDTGIQLSILGNLGTNWTITDNIFTRPWSRGSLDTDGDHPDTVLGSGNNTSTADCLVTFKRNRAWHGGTRGVLGGYNFRNLNGTGKWIITGGGNIHVGDCNQPFTVHDANSCVLTYNTFVNGQSGGTVPTVDIGFETGNNSHTFTNNIIEVTSPTVLGANNVRLGAAASNATYLTAFAGPTMDLSAFASTLADLMSNFAMKAGGPAALNGGADYGAIVPSVVTFASASPGHAGASGP